jgi:hypothetical protein
MGGVVLSSPPVPPHFGNMRGIIVVIMRATHAAH